MKDFRHNTKNTENRTTVISFLLAKNQSEGKILAVPAFRMSAVGVWRANMKQNGRHKSKSEKRNDILDKIYVNKPA